MIELQTITTPAAQQIGAPPAAQQTGTPPAVAQQQEQTLTGRFFKGLFTAIFYSQLILISILVIFLTLRGLVFTKSPRFHPKKWYIPLLASVAVSGVVSLAWQCFFVCNIARTVNATLWFTPILTVTLGVFLLAYGPSFQGSVCFLKREFTVKIMLISTGVTPERTRAIAVVSVILSVFYSAFLVAGIGGATATRSRLDILFISIIVISLAWTMQVLKNVQQVAISKATYVYFARDEFMNACNALSVTVRNQLGTVCIGSTLVPVFVLVRGTIRGIHPREMYATDRDCSWIANHMILYGNRWGFVHVGVYNKSFVQGSGDTWRTFRRMAGLEELIDTDLTSSICFLSAFAVGAISALTAGIWEFLIHKDYIFSLTLYAFIIGYFVGRVSSAWLQGCVMGYYVAYSEDPQSGNFDNTIPQRIARLDIEAAQREASNEVREEDEQNISYM
ncbi:unnamed protein product [Arabis nemorensis]|uniref:Choline transporter-like protein n=1 Tax=Arabis nemorensis TaxID=586526 RepID=A0A565CMS2_9BRAS|nr:unnamed protein product [Arabis nemorensis]